MKSEAEIKFEKAINEFVQFQDTLSDHLDPGGTLREQMSNVLNEIYAKRHNLADVINALQKSSDSLLDAKTTHGTEFVANKIVSKMDAMQDAAKQLQQEMKQKQWNPSSITSYSRRDRLIGARDTSHISLFQQKNPQPKKVEIGRRGIKEPSERSAMIGHRKPRQG